MNERYVKDAAAHRWVRTRLDAHATGLLDEREMSRFQAHLDECDLCRRAVAAHAEGTTMSRPADAHIPASLLSRWDRARERLRGIERRLVREHLEGCPVCRQDLGAIGFEPVLARDLALEGGPADALAPAPPLEAPTTTVIRLDIRRPGRRERLIQWALGGVGGALATVAAIMLVVPNLMHVTPAAHGPAVTPAPEAAPASAQPVDRYTLVLVPEARTLRGGLRGSAGPAETVIRASDSTRFVPFRLPELYVSARTPIEIEIQGPAGLSILTARFKMEELIGTTSLMLGRSQDPLAPGTYVIVVKAGPDPEEAESRVQVQQYRLRLEHVTRN